MDYVTILESEFDNIFKPEKRWEKEYSGHTNEIVYVKRFIKRPNVVVKVYSSIHKKDGVSRGCGTDAIRVCAVNTVTNRGVIKSNRINRVPGWETRLKKKVTDVWNAVLDMN